MVRTAVAMVAAVLAVAPAAAQGNGRAADRVLAPFLACRAQRDPASRAACFDAALDRLQAQVAQRQVVIVDHEQAAQDRRAFFGFGADHGAEPRPPRPAAPPRGARAPAEEVQEVDSTVVSAQPYGYDQWTIRIATGAVWRTTESGVAAAPRPGTPIRIRRGVMNGYLLRLGSGRTVRALRVN